MEDIMPAKDLFSSKFALNKFVHCGILSSYLDHFSDWMSEREYQKDTLRTYITNVAHFSNYLKGVSLKSIKALNEHIEDFLYVHIPGCRCTGWNQIRRSNRVSTSINLFEKFLADCYGLSFGTNFKAYPVIHKEYLLWLSEKREFKMNSVKTFSGYLKKFLKWCSAETDTEAIQKLKACDIERFFLKRQEHTVNLIKNL